MIWHIMNFLIGFLLLFWVHKKIPDTARTQCQVHRQIRMKVTVPFWKKYQLVFSRLYFSLVVRKRPVWRPEVEAIESGSADVLRSHRRKHPTHPIWQAVRLSTLFYLIPTDHPLRETKKTVPTVILTLCHIQSVFAAYCFTVRAQQTSCLILWSDCHSSSETTWCSL